MNSNPLSKIFLINARQWPLIVARGAVNDKQDPIAHAARLLREAAEELRQAHAYNNSEGWRDERDSDDDELPEREDDPPPANTFHISRQWVATV